MFVAVAGPRAGGAALADAAAALRGATSIPRCWWDGGDAAAMAGMASGILPEDRHDRQPWTIGDLTLACAARLDNRTELLAALGIAAHDSVAMSDGEIVARTWSRYGEDSLQRLYGDWALVAWDAARQRLSAAVDHIGSVPLYYHVRGDDLLLATQLAALATMCSERFALDLRALGLMVAPHMGLGWTMFEQVAHLPGGSLLTWQAGRLDVLRWWQPSTERCRDGTHACVEQAGALLQDAVAQRLRRVGPLTTMLSGGLDSTLVTAVAARQLATTGDSLTAYTSVPDPGVVLEHRADSIADEGPLAGAVAALHPNIVHRLVAPARRTTLDVLPAIHRTSRTVVRNTANLLWICRIAEQAQGDGARVVLVGDRGNVSLSISGVPRDGLIEMLRRLVVRPVAPVPYRSANRPGRRFLSPDFQAAWPAELLRRPAEVPSMALWHDSAVAPLRAPRADMMAMYGADLRDPLADRRLIEALLRFPPAAFHAGRRSRGLAREVARGYLPDAVRLCTARGHQSADQAGWFVRDAPRYRALLDAMQRSAGCRQLFDFAALVPQVAALMDGAAIPMHVINSVHRAFDVGLFVTTWEGDAW